MIASVAEAQTSEEEEDSDGSSGAGAGAGAGGAKKTSSKTSRITHSVIMDDGDEINVDDI